MRRILTGALLIAVWAAPSGAEDHKQHQHPVIEVRDSLQVVLSHDGLPVTVELAGMSVPARQKRKATALLVDLLEDADVAVVPALPAAGEKPALTRHGLPLVYLEKGDELVNAAVIRQGFAKVKKSPRAPADYGQQLMSAQKQARLGKLGMWLKGAAAKEAVVAEIGHELYHRPSCRWAKKIRASKRVRYASRDEAMLAGKRPCNVCRPNRVEEAGR